MINKLIVVAVFVFIALILLSKLPPKHRSIDILTESGYKTSVTKGTFRGFASEQIAADKDGERLLLQIVKGVESGASDQVLTDLGSILDTVRQKVIVYDPYTGKERELGVPDTLKPAEETISLRDHPFTYSIVYANEIYSLKIFSDSEAAYKGLFSTYYCPRQKAAYRVEVYAKRNYFDKQKAINLLTSLYCQK